MTAKNKILSLELEDTEIEIELGDGGKEHTRLKVMGACVQVIRGHKITTGRQYLESIGVNPDLVDRWEIVIPRHGGKKTRRTTEAWHEYVDNCDQHLENNETVKRLLKSGALQDIYKINVKDFPPTMTQEQLWNELEYRLPE